MKEKFNIAFIGGDSHAGTINDFFLDALPLHERVAHVDFEWTSQRFGKHVRDAVHISEILPKIGQYDLVFINAYENRPEVRGLFDKLWGKLILYDINDDSYFHYHADQQKCLLYLKRAWDESINPEHRKNIIPTDFALLQMYLDAVPIGFYPNRDMAVTCTLPQNKNGTARYKVVTAVKNADWPHVKDWVQQMTLFYSSGWILSSAATSYRCELTPLPPHINWWYVYIHMLRRTKILFNAANHSAIGDHRTWEAFASGALVITDRIPGSCPNPPIPGEHYIKFNLNNPDETIEIAKELLGDTEQREKIAKAGLEHAIKYHSSKGRVEHIMGEIIKRLKDGTN